MMLLALAGKTQVVGRHSILVGHPHKPCKPLGKAVSNFYLCLKPEGKFIYLLKISLIGRKQISKSINGFSSKEMLC